jgi:hypothetical protein
LVQVICEKISSESVEASGVENGVFWIVGDSVLVLSIGEVSGSHGVAHPLSGSWVSQQGVSGGIEHAISPWNVEVSSINSWVGPWSSEVSWVSEVSVSSWGRYYGYNIHSKAIGESAKVEAVLGIRVNSAVMENSHWSFEEAVIDSAPSRSVEWKSVNISNSGSLVINVHAIVVSSP